MDSLHNLDTADLIQKLRNFANERDWNQFHTPKNLVMALSVEASELLEHFQWMESDGALELIEDSDQTRGKREEIAEEVSDILFYLLRFSDVMNLDLVAATEAKLEKNAKKYPAEKVRGNSKKYNEYD